MKQEKTQHKTTALVLRLLFSLLFLNSGKSYSQKDTVPLVPATPKVFASLTIGEVVVGTKIIETSEKLNIMDNEFLELRLKMEDLNELNSAIHYKYRIIKPNSETEIKWIETNNPIIIAVSFIQGNHVIEIKPLIRGLKNPGQIIKYSFCVVSPFFRGEYFNQLILIIMLSIIIFGLWTQRKFVRTRSELSKTQISLLRGALNPHMIFNSLNTLTYLIPEAPNKAVNFVQKLSKVYRYILEIRDQKIVSISDELEFLNAYIFLLKERFGENLNTNIDIPLKYYQTKIVPLSLQILFENVIKHNIISTKKPLTINVFIERDKLIIKNNLQKKNQVISSTSMGLQNIKNRYQFFTKKEVDVIVTVDSFLVALPLFCDYIASEKETSIKTAII